MNASATGFVGRRAAYGGYVLLFLAATAIAFYVILPVRAGQVGYDAAASVLYFDRLVQGRHLEGFVGTTPKPLLTVVYGLVYNIFHDWRPISWLAIGVLGSSAVLAAVLVRRFAGLPGAAFAGLAVIGLEALLKDASLSYAVGWAFAGCLLAGLAVSEARPRYAWAGVALALAGLARIEVVLIPGLALVVLSAVWVSASARRRPAPDRRPWLVLIGLLAIPIQLVHDWLLTGNALYSESVPGIGSAGLALNGPGTWIVLIAEHVLKLGVFVVLAGLGVVLLWRARQWAMLVGLAAMGPGVAAFLVLLAARRIYVSARYLDPIDVSIMIAAAIGFGALGIPSLGPAAGRLFDRPRAPAWARPVAIVALTALVVLVASTPFAPTNRALRLTIRGNLDIERDARAALPTIRTAVEAMPGVADWPGPAANQPAALLVPTLLKPQFMVDLGLPVGQVGSGLPATMRTDGSFPRVGQIVFHDQRSEPDPAFDFLEVSTPTIIGAIKVTPLLASPANGYWVVRIDPAP
jgi:hypothetical protein